MAFFLPLHPHLVPLLSFCLPTTLVSFYSPHSPDFLLPKRFHTLIPEWKALPWCQVNLHSAFMAQVSITWQPNPPPSSPSQASLSCVLFESCFLSFLAVTPLCDYTLIYIAIGLMFASPHNAVGVKSMDDEAKWPVFKVQFWHLTSYVTLNKLYFPCLSFLNCKMGTIISTHRVVRI